MLARLTGAMQRNTTLAAGTASTPAAHGPAASYTPAPPKLHHSATRRRSGIRLYADDTRRIAEVIQAGLPLGATLAMSQVIRLALRAYDPKRLNADDIMWLRTANGNSRSAKGVLPKV